MAMRIDQRCSFCGKTRDQVDRLVAGPGVFICDQCVALCNEIMSEPPPTPPAETAGRVGWVASPATTPKRPFWRRFTRIGAAAPV